MGRDCGVRRAHPPVDRRLDRHRGEELPPPVGRPPPCYDMLLLTAEQVAPAPGQPIRFLDVPAGQATARAFRLRVRGCRSVTAQATVSAGFSLLSASVTSPEPEGFETRDALVWVLFTAGNAGDTASGTLTVTVPDTGDTFSVPIEANVVAKPTVASSLVLDRSGSMDLSSGVAGQTRLEVLKSAAPLFAHLLGDDDGVGVVRFAPSRRFPRSSAAACSRSASAHPTNSTRGPWPTSPMAPAATYYSPGTRAPQTLFHPR